jgi:hypothetical protein
VDERVAGRWWRAAAPEGAVAAPDADSGEPAPGGS